MKATEDLFVLIKSLTKSEKRHFKLFSGLQTGKKKYLQLFDVILAQEKYDEPAIIKQMKAEKLTINFSVAKAYLFESILNSLEIFHSNKSIDAQIRKQISHIKILTARNQYAASRKLVARAKKTAEEFDLFSYAIELSVIEESIIMNQHELSYLEKTREQRYLDENNIINKLKNFQEYRKLAAWLMVRGEKLGRARSRNLMKMGDEKINHNLLTNPSNALSDRALISYYFQNGTHRHFKNDNSGSLKHFMALKHFIEKKPQYRQIYFYTYLYTLNNILSVGAGILKFKKTLEVLSALKNLKHHFPVVNANIQLRYYSQLSQNFISYKRYAEAVNSAAEIEKWLEQNRRHKLNTLHEISLQINLIIIYFMASKYKLCLQHINYVLNNELQDIAYDKYGFVRLLNLLVHFELGNFDLLPGVAQSAYRYFYKHNRLYKFENLILNFIQNKVLIMHTLNDRIDAFKNLKKEFKKIARDPMEKLAVEYFDFVFWLDSKIQNKPISEFIRKKHP